jgi:hypothetical protein
MKSLIIEETQATPKVILDLFNDNYEIEGCSRPENVREFYLPIIGWLKEYYQNIDDKLIAKYTDNQLVFKFKLDYFNSSSAKFILDILILINNIYEKGLNIRIDWYYDENDDDMKEVGEELSEVVDFQFKYITT